MPHASCIRGTAGYKEHFLCLSGIAMMMLVVVCALSFVTGQCNRVCAGLGWHGAKDGLRDSGIIYSIHDRQPVMSDSYGSVTAASSHHHHSRGRTIAQDHSAGRGSNRSIRSGSRGPTAVGSG